MQATVEEAVAMLRLDGPFQQAQYVRYMQQAFGRDGTRFLDGVDAWLAGGADPEDAARLYQALAKRPAMAAYVSRHQYSGLYAEVGQMFAKYGVLHDRCVIDCGCGFGLLTQLLARLHPESQFVGLDREAIIRAARKLAENKTFENLQFESNPIVEIGDGRQRVILLVCVTHEMFPAVLPADADFLDEAHAGESLSALVGVNDLVVTINRFPHPARQLPRLDAVMEHLGLHVTSSALPGVLSVQEPGMASNLPIRVYSRHTSGEIKPNIAYDQILY